MVNAKISGTFILNGSHLKGDDGLALIANGLTVTGICFVQTGSAPKAGSPCPAPRAGIRSCAAVRIWTARE